MLSKTLDNDAKGKVLSLKDKMGDKTVAEIQAEKHNEGQPIKPSCFVSHEKGNALPFYNSIFDKIEDKAIERAAQKTKGSLGPSSPHSCQEKTSDLIRQCLNQIPENSGKNGYSIATEVLPSTSLEGYNNSRLIPDNECPSVRPIEIGEIKRRINRRCISSFLGAENREIEETYSSASGNMQLPRVFDHENCEVVLLIDELKAFNLLNRTTDPKKICRKFPSLQILFTNSYQTQKHFFFR